MTNDCEKVFKFFLVQIWISAHYSMYLFEWRSMQLRIEGDTLFVDTDVELNEPYLRQCSTGYQTYWHFIKDFHLYYKKLYTPTKEFKDALRKKVAERNEIGKLLAEDFDFEQYAELLNGDLRQYPFQAKASRFIEYQKRVLLADEVGLGKTIIALTTALSLIEQGKVMKVYVMVPASLRLQWLGECRKFINRDMFPDLELVLNNKPKNDRHYVYKNFTETDNPIIMLTSYDLTRRDKQKVYKLPVDMLICDEGSQLKNGSSKITKAVKHMSKKIPYMIIMNAVPLENGLDDLYSVTSILTPKRFHNKEYFTDQYLLVQTKKIWVKGRPMNIPKVIGYKNVDDARMKMHGMYIRRTVDEVDKELPEMITQTVELELTDVQQKLYDEVSGKVKGDLTRKDLLGKMSNLHSICDSAELIDGSKKSSVKVKELKRMLDEDFKYSKVIIISQYKRMIEILKRELKSHEPLVITGDTDMGDRQFIVKQFNESTRNVLMGTEAIQKGLNLQVASVLLNFDLPWNPADLEQRRGRFHRIGSPHRSIRMVNLITKGTVEYKIMEKLYHKGELFEKIFKQDAELRISNLLNLSQEDLASFMSEEDTMFDPKVA